MAAATATFGSRSAAVSHPGPRRCSTGVQLSREKVGNAGMLVGALLFLAAVVADAPTALVVIPLLIQMGGALLTVTGSAR